MSDYEYKIASLDDIDELVCSRVETLRAANLLGADADMSAVVRTSREYYLRAIPLGEHVAVLVYDSGKIIGTGGVSFYTVMPTVHIPDGRRAYIMNMYTHPDYRRRGIARRTLEMLVAQCRKAGIAEIGLEATAAGRPLYESFGFTNAENEMNLRNGE